MAYFFIRQGSSAFVLDLLQILERTNSGESRVQPGFTKSSLNEMQIEKAGAKMNMPKFSVISIAKRERELENLRKALADQTFQDFELVISTKGTIPEAWNDAISRAKGELLVFTESDAIPLNNRWLEEIAKRARKNMVLKGLEIGPTDFNMCNLVCDASIFEQARFDESFTVEEDMELFARLRKMGVKMEFSNAFPVIHIPRHTWRKTFSRTFKGGMLCMKIIYLHGRSNIDNINTMNLASNYIHPISYRFLMIAENVLHLLGLVVGTIRYLPIVLKRKVRRVVKTLANA